MSKLTKDKQQELLRYEDRAKSLLTVKAWKTISNDPCSTIPISLRRPYIEYIKILNKYLSSDLHVLEIGSGTGAWTRPILKSGANLVATDISENSLRFIEKRYSDYGNKLKTKVADMEDLPFDSNSFNIICSAGSMSYGDSCKVKNEIIRVLKPRGLFICVDSLNDNPIYRCKRYLDYFLGKRTYSTIISMPRISLLKDYEQSFSVEELSFFGSMSWMAVVLEKIVGGTKAAKFSDRADNFFRSNYLSFKFVMALKLKDKVSDSQSSP